MNDRAFLVGLIGGNIMKSLSPALHDDAFAAAGLRGHYHLMDLNVLTGRTLPDLLSAVRLAGFAGTNITYPCKEQVLPLLDDIAQPAREIGAVNTVTIARDGRSTGYNTDRPGFARSFAETLGRAAVEGKDAALVGAGGAGRAVAFALIDLGAASVLIYDTDFARADALANELKKLFGAGRAHALRNTDDAIRSAAGVVNATPLGMHGIPGDPVPLGDIGPGHWVADVIYTPLETALIKNARAKGARVLTGGGMCVHQAAEAFRLFTGISPDIDRMRAFFDRAVAARDAALALAH